MIRDRFRSLQLRLAVRLAVLYVAATALVVGVLVYRAYDTAGTLNDRELSLRAKDLAEGVSVDPRGVARLDLPPKLEAAYKSASGADIFAIRGPGRRIVAASPPSFGELVVGWPAATDDPSYFHLKDFGVESQDYYGLSISLDSVAGPLAISVARAAGADALIHSLLREFVLDIAWVIPLLVLITLAIGVLAIRSGLKPVREVSEMASVIGPSTTSVRLPEENLPNEIMPLVAAMNRALDRLEQGFAVQRQFTANAAHELRTPLTIITAALDAMDGNGELAKLKADVARMNRLVEQLLRVARLDAIAVDVSGTVDLNAIAIGVVEAMAPWAMTQDRTIAFGGPDKPVQVKGNAHAIADALRNIVENGVTHSPPGTEVVVSTHPDGSVSVADQGSGIPEEDRPRIFERFWRGRGVASQGAGLGLAIVMEIVKAHRGSVRVDDGPNSGAVVTLYFSLAHGETRKTLAPREVGTSDPLQTGPLV
jgi:signal transduction histidine kinase